MGWYFSDRPLEDTWDAVHNPAGFVDSLSHQHAVGSPPAARRADRVQFARPPGADAQDTDDEGVVPQVTGTPDPEAEALWCDILPDLRLMVPRPTFETWYAKLVGYRLSGDVLTVGALDPVAAAWANRRAYHNVATAATARRGQETEIVFAVVEPELETGALEAEAMTNEVPQPSDDFGQLNPEDGGQPEAPPPTRPARRKRRGFAKVGRR